MDTTLVADVGGTNTRCALLDGDGRVGAVTTFRNAEYGGLAEVLAAFAGRAAARPVAAVLAIAAPIGGDEVSMINIGWRFSRAALAEALGLRRLVVMNDFAALAWALPCLGDAELVAVGGGAAAPGGARVVLGPGTGLGVATLVEGDAGLVAVPGEGGHVTLAAADEAEERVVGAMRARFGHCSAERLVSGPGLALLHAALHGGPALAPDDIGRAFLARDAAAAETFGMFFRLLGTVAANAALTVGATGGVYIGGGIVPRYAEAFAHSGFRARFEAKGRYRDFMAAIPTRVITAAHPALAGLAARARTGAA